MALSHYAHRRLGHHRRVPAGADVTTLTALEKRGPISGGDWIRGVTYTVAVAFFGVASPNLVFKDEDSPHAFTEAQMGPFATPAAITSAD